ncbi:MAG: hypothetical protein AAFX04_06375 [Pseudomonadota bacterium]
MARKFFAGALALSALASHQAALAQDNAASCATVEQAEALMIAVMPGIIRSVSDLCQPHLPAGAELATSSSHVDTVLVPAAREAFPTALDTFMVIGGTEMPAELRSLGYDQLMPLLDGVLGQQIAGDIKPESCGSINRIYTSLKAMSPQQSASLIVALVEISGDKESPLKICPITAAGD